jgi:hypothetical protein
MNLDELVNYMVNMGWEMYPIKPNDSHLMFKRDNYRWMIDRKNYSFWNILDANEGYLEYKLKKDEK